MRVTAWNNGSPTISGAGYGVKIAATDRDRHFRRDWKAVVLYLEGETQPVSINVEKKSFWSTSCRELISAEIGRWLIKNDLAPWPKGYPPELELEPFEKPGQFRLKKA